MLKKVKKIIFAICLWLLVLANGCAPKNGFYGEMYKEYYYKDGKKLYGWILVGNDWYYSELEGDKGILKNTMLQDGDAYYYLDGYGKMVIDKIVDGMYFGADGKQVFNSMIEKDGKIYRIDGNGKAKVYTPPVYTFKSDMGLPINIYIDYGLPQNALWDTGSGDRLNIGTIEEVSFDLTKNYFIIRAIVTAKNIRFMKAITATLKMTDSKGVKSAIEDDDSFDGINSGEKTYMDFKFNRGVFPLSGGDIYLSFKGGY